MDYLWSPWRYRYLTSEPKLEGCIFCQMAVESDDERNLIVHRGEYNFVVLNRYPYTSGHLMVVPYAHAAQLNAVEEVAAFELMKLARESETHIREVYNPNGLNIGMNIGESAGAGIAGHIHLHVLPRWAGDSNFMTVVGETRVLPEDLDVTWKKLSAAFRTVQR